MWSFDDVRGRGAGGPCGPAERAPARCAEVSSEKDGSPADADGSGAPATNACGPVEQGIDLLYPCLDCHQFRATLDDERGAEAVSLVHLEREPTEVAESLLSYLEKCFALALQLPCRGNDVLGRGYAWCLEAASTLSPCHASTLELKDDESLFGHLPNRIRGTLARVARVLDSAVGHLVGAECRCLIDRDPAELELARGT